MERICRFAGVLILLAAFSAAGSGLRQEPLTTIRVPAISLDRVRVREVVQFLRITCETHAEKVGYRLQWLASENRDDSRVTVDTSPASLAHILQIVTPICGLQARFENGTLTVADEGVHLDPLETRTFDVLPGFWKAVRNALPPDVPPGREHKNASVLSFLGLLGLRPETGTAIRVSTDHTQIHITATATELDLVRDVLKTTCTTPCRWEVQIDVLTVADPKLFRNIEKHGVRNEQESTDYFVSRLITDGKVRKEDSLTIDLFPMAPVERNLEFPIKAGGTVSVKLRMMPKEMLGLQEAYQTQFRVETTIAQSREAAVKLLLDTTVLLAEEDELLIPLTGASNQLGNSIPHVFLMISGRPCFPNAMQAPPPKDDENKPQSGLSPPHTRLRELIFPHVEFDEMPLPEVMKALRKEARALDPDGKGVAIDLLLCEDATKRETTPAPPPNAKNMGEDPFRGFQDTRNVSDRTLTMNMDNIPLGEILRYVGMGCGLRMWITAEGCAVADRRWALQSRTELLGFIEAPFNKQTRLWAAKFTDQKRLEQFLGECGVPIYAGCWVRGIQFPFGLAIVARGDVGQLARTGRLLSCMSKVDPAYRVCHIRTRVELLDIHDPALVEEVAEFAGKRRSDQERELSARLRQSPRVTCQNVLEVRSITDHEGSMSVRVLGTDGEKDLTLSVLPTQWHAGCCVSSRLRCSLGSRHAGQPERSPWIWASTFHAYAGHVEPPNWLILPIGPSTIDGKANGLRVLLVRTTLAGMTRVQEFHTDDVASDQGETQEGDADREANENMPATDATQTSADSSLDSEQQTFHSTSWWASSKLPGQPQFAMGLVFDPMVPGHAEQLSNGLTSTHGTRKYDDACIRAANGLHLGPEQFHVLFRSRGKPEDAMGILLLENSTGTITMPIKDSTSSSIVTIKLETLLKRDLYRLQWERTNRDGSTQVGYIFVPWDRSVDLSDISPDMQITVGCIDRFGIPLPPPLAKAVDALERERLGRKSRLEKLLAQLDRIPIRQFSVPRGAPLSEAVRLLRPLLKEAHETPWLSNAMVIPPAKWPGESYTEEVPISQGGKTASATDDDPLDDLAKLFGESTYKRTTKTRRRYRLFDPFASTNLRPTFLLVKEKRDSEDNGGTGTHSNPSFPLHPRFPNSWQTGLLTGMELRDTTLGAIVRRIQTDTGCRIDVLPGKGIEFTPIVELSRRRFSVPRGLYPAKPDDLHRALSKWGVVPGPIDFAVYMPDLDTLLAAGTDAFIESLQSLVDKQKAP